MSTTDATTTDVSRAEQPDPEPGSLAAADVVELLRTALDRNPDAVRAALTLRPCHITGMHQPDHHLDFTCESQRATMFSELLAAICVTEDGLPRGLHGADCYWCHTIPSQEEYRDRLRRTWQWAGVTVTKKLAATAADGWHPGDDEAVMAAYTALRDERGAEVWLSRVDVKERLAEMDRSDIGFVRIGIVQRKMTGHGLLEEALIDGLYRNRLTGAPS